MANGIVLNIDTTKSEFQNPMIELRQGDGNYQSIDVTVTSNGSPFNLTGWTITFMGTTAGGFKIVDTAVSNVDTANGKFTYTPTKAWGQDEGMFKEAYFKFTSGANGNSVASGASIRVNVLTAVDLTAEEAGDYISIVDQTIATLNEDLTTLQSSVDQLKAQNNAIKTTDNTWTGTNTFNKQITGSLKTRPATFTNFAQVASDMVQYAGLWFVNAQTMLNSPISGTLYGIIEVIPAYGSITGIIRYSNVPNWGSGNYVTTVDNGAINGWEKTPDNASVVHNTGTETVAGDKTFTGKNTFIQNISGNITGNSGTTTKLQTPRRINGTNFDGASDINVNAANDVNLVHRTGAETISGAKEFTDRSVFDKAIYGKFESRVLPDGTDLYTLIESGLLYSVPDAVKSSTIINRPSEVTTAFGILSIDTAGYTKNGWAGTNLLLFEFSTGKMFMASLVSNNSGVITVLKKWTKIATDESLLVHNAGTETIAGNKTFTGNNNFSGATTLQNGNYGLRVTNSGVQKTSDGGTTWVNI